MHICHEEIRMGLMALPFVGMALTAATQWFRARRKP